jgi:hypothetical protein
MDQVQIMEVIHDGRQSSLLVSSSGLPQILWKIETTARSSTNKQSSLNEESFPEY